jgi:hypothetical protein
LGCGCWDAEEGNATPEDCELNSTAAAALAAVLVMRPFEGAACGWRVALEDAPERVLGFFKDMLATEKTQERESCIDCENSFGSKAVNVQYISLHDRHVMTLQSGPRLSQLKGDHGEQGRTNHGE